MNYLGHTINDHYVRIQKAGISTAYIMFYATVTYHGIILVVNEIQVIEFWGMLLATK